MISISFNRFTLIIFSTLFSLQLASQNANSELQLSGSRSDSLFNAGLYSQAIPLLNAQLDRYPQEPILHYQLGISYLNSTRNTEKAIHHLRFASTREVPNLVYFFLAKALHLSYQFDEAMSYYRRFAVNGGHQQVSNQQIEQLANQCENGAFMLKYIYQPNIIDSKRVAIADFNQFIITKPQGGSFIPLPNELKSSTDSKQNHQSLIFYPTQPKPGDKLVFSSYGSTTSFGLDLYVTEMLEDGLWSKPKNLGEIVNSKQDENYPYLAADGVTLYFASKGHYSMGGYDLYRSVYNPNTQQWATPENVSFPFSSTHDDLLFVPDAKEEMAILVTNRNYASDSVDVVLIKVDQNPIRRSIESLETVRSIAQLKPSKGQRPVTGNVEKENDKKPQQQKVASFSAVENDPEYTRSLANGFASQMRADSLRNRLENLRKRFDHITTAEARKALESQVVSVEDDLLSSQRNADIQFARASQIEQEFLTGKRKPADKPLSTFASDKPEYLYQAQFAATIFQPDELSKLAQLEALTPQVQQKRKQVENTFATLTAIQQLTNEDSLKYREEYKTYATQLQQFNSLMSSHITGKIKLYADCISVALMKGGANNNQDIKAHIDRANSHFHSAKIIRNNAEISTVYESEYEALLLDEIGALRLEIAFAKLWDMRLFEQQLLSKAAKLEQSIFGHTLPQIGSPHQENPLIVEVQQIDETPIITRVDTTATIAGEIEFEEEKEPSFVLHEKSPYSTENPFQMHTPAPTGVMYKIQLAAFSNPIKFDFFKGMAPISKELLSNGKITKYYAGNFSYLEDAEKALPTVRSNGFKDAFIVAWHDGRSVAPTRAKALEQNQTPSPQPQPVAIEIEGGTRMFMVQIGTFQGKLPNDITQTVRALAQGKDIIRKPDGQGGFIFSVGSFTDMNEATRVKDNIVASGIKSATVVAVDIDN